MRCPTARPVWSTRPWSSRVEIKSSAIRALHLGREGGREGGRDGWSVFGGVGFYPPSSP